LYKRRTKRQGAADMVSIDGAIQQVSKMAEIPDISEPELRRRIIEAGREMNRCGLNQGTSGNISLRLGDGLLITPTSLPYDEMVAEDIVFLAMDGTPIGRHEPSSEWRFHRDILREKPAVNAVVHAHPPYATTIAIMGKAIPPLHYMIAVAGGHDIPCAAYATFGTEELSRNALEALRDRSACLLEHHGLIATGPSLARAMWLAVEVETLARQFHGCLAVGGPRLLPRDEIERVRLKMANYGHRSRDDAA
jgi:L-fuculose-phosphate aldolase